MFSFLDTGTESTILSIATNGAPALENSILFLNTSTIGFVPRCCKSWCIIAFANISRIAISGKLIIDFLVASTITSSCGIIVIIYCTISSWEKTYPPVNSFSRIASNLEFSLYQITLTERRCRFSNFFRSFAIINAPILEISQFPASFFLMNFSCCKSSRTLSRFLGIGISNLS